MFWNEKKECKYRLDSREKRVGYASRVRDIDRGIGAFLEFDPQRLFDAAEEESAAGPASERNSSAEEGALSGIPFAVKDNIAVKGFRLTCGSRILSDFTSPYTATAVEKMMAAGALMVGKTNLDEFGMGSSTDNSALQRTHNPWDPTRVAGGSSGGSAAAVAAGMVPCALGSDTGGSIRQPASFCGVYGLKPTYGSVSRFGLVAYASSLEGIGVLSASLPVMKTAFEVIKGADEHDQTSGTAAGPPAGTRTIGVVKNIDGLSPGVDRGYKNTIEELRSLGYEVMELDLPILEYVIPAYYTIASAEASANLARYAGIRYGYQNDMAEDPRELTETSRDQGFGPEVKMRILLGTFVLRSGFQEQYYIRAQKIRTALRNEFDRLFRGTDVLMMPTFPVQAFQHDSTDMDQFQQKMADKFTATANLAGIPALAFPTGFEDGLPVGMQFMAPMYAEERLFKAAESFQKVFTPQLSPAAGGEAQEGPQAGCETGGPSGDDRERRRS